MQVYSGLSTFVPAHLSPWKAPSLGIHMPHFLASLRALLNHPITHEAFQNQHTSTCMCVCALTPHPTPPPTYIHRSSHLGSVPLAITIITTVLLRICIISFCSLECSFKNYHIPRTISLVYVLHSRCSKIQ